MLRHDRGQVLLAPYQRLKKIQSVMVILNPSAQRFRRPSELEAHFLSISGQQLDGSLPLPGYRQNLGANESGFLVSRIVM